MSTTLKIAHCPLCGEVYQKNLRNMCQECSSAEDRMFSQLEFVLRRNRKLTTEEAAVAAGIPVAKIRSWIRTGKLTLGDYPNLADKCDLCKAPIRSGHLCSSCSRRIRTDIAKVFEQERLIKERHRTSVYLSKR